MSEVSKYLSKIGGKGGAAKTAAKQAASAENGKKGGRPPVYEKNDAGINFEFRWSGGNQVQPTLNKRAASIAAAEGVPVESLHIAAFSETTDGKKLIYIKEAGKRQFVGIN